MAISFPTVAEWTGYLETLSPPETIHLGLERMRELLERLSWRPEELPVITVGGTNGKGSTVALLESILRHAGYRVGAYLSPHLLRYHERIRIEGQDIGEAALCAGMTAVEQARGDLPLTFFEFGTAVALWVFREAPVDLAVLEVGLGGRLDAVNAVDPLAAAVTRIGIDHVEWLGPDRESIGVEKAGIFRSGRPAIVGDPAPPRSLSDVAGRLGADLWLRGVDFDGGVDGRSGSWSYRGRKIQYRELPAPGLAGSIQYGNAATALALLESLNARWPVDEPAIRAGLVHARLAGRFEWRQWDSGPAWCLDVAHNPQAAGVLADELSRRAAGIPCHLVFGMMRDKDLEGFIEPFVPLVDVFHPVGLPPPRGLGLEELTERLHARLPYARIEPWEDLPEAVMHCRQLPEPNAVYVVTGSFRTLERMIPLIESMCPSAVSGMPILEPSRT
jgi:dihydrofolate synthase/folylpolyglutamate synthase